MRERRSRITQALHPGYVSRLEAGTRRTRLAIRCYGLAPPPASAAFGSGLGLSDKVFK
jgi:hypothetical protein